MICCPCSPTLVVAPLPTPLPGPGEPGGTLPAGTEPGQFLQWNGVLWVPSSWTLPEASPVVVGDVLTVTAPGVAEFQAPAVQVDRIQYAFGNNSINTGTQFVFPWLSNGATEGSEIRIQNILFDGVLRLLRVLHATPVGADNLTYTIRIGATVGTLADTALAVTLNSGASAGSNLVTSVAVTAGQVLSMKVTGATVARTVRMSANLVLEIS